MTAEEFKTQFNIFYNSIASNVAPSVNDFEISSFLTAAQKDIIVELYNGRNIAGLSFESTEEARAYLRELITEHTYTFTDGKDEVTLPDNCWFITLEECKYDTTDKCKQKVSPIITPVRQDEFAKIKNNPFRGPSLNRVIRIDTPNGLKLYSKEKIKEYKIMYIRNPYPIILEDLTPYELSIDGKQTPFKGKGNEVCELNPVLHKAILDRAVRLAKVAYLGN